MPLRLEDYDVSPATGFLPEESPLRTLSSDYYSPWETIISNLQALILTRRIRGVVDNLPELSTDLLVSPAEWRRAYSILGFMSHAYIWSGDRPCERVPPSISIPFTAVCHRLELPTVATYAAVVLWNFKSLFAGEAFDRLDNLSTLTTFTGAQDESWFYLISVAIEARGAPCIPLMLDAIDAANAERTAVVTECLRSFAERLDELGSLLTRMYENCDPGFFYHKIRPFLAGSKNMAEAGLPNGVLFDTRHSADEYVQYSGGSNAQSSIIQFFDIVLGIEHRPTGQKTKEARRMADGPSTNFIKDMRTYMPGPHARLLAEVEDIANIRAYVAAHRHNAALVTAFDACLAMLHAFRDKHIQMVSRYIIIKSRESRTQGGSPDGIHRPVVAPSTKLNLASATDARAKRRPSASDGAGPKGTGGTSLIPFLKQARDETGAPAVDAWTRRLLGPARGSQRGVRLGKMGEHASGETEILGLGGVWHVDDDEMAGGICHW